MAAYVLLLIAFPHAMTTWPAPLSLGAAHLDLAESLRYVFTGALPAGVLPDAITSATALDFARTELHRNLTLHEIAAAPLFGVFAGRGIEVVNSLVLAGGLWLLYRRIISWHVPAALLGTLALLAATFHGIDPDTHAGLLFHLLGGGAMLGAFFIATDPTTGATSPRGRLLFGAGVGLLVFVIRTWGSYPDGVAFAVLLMNMAAPTLDHYTRPRVYGHGKG
jgi:electron transport complex protein RnfD